VTSPHDQKSTSKYTEAERTQPDPGRTEYIPEGMGKWSRFAAIVFVIIAVGFWLFVFSPFARDNKDQELIERWLEDWDFYLADRVAHADKLRNGDDSRFLNTERDGIFIAERMSGFARVNEFRSCLPPGDL